MTEYTGALEAHRVLFVAMVNALDRAGIGDLLAILDGMARLRGLRTTPSAEFEGEVASLVDMVRRMRPEVK
jgi:hypothetical protein